MRRVQTQEGNQSSWSCDDQIQLRGLRVDCIIGLYERERLCPQPLELDITIGLASLAAMPAILIADRHAGYSLLGSLTAQASSRIHPTLRW